MLLEAEKALCTGINRLFVALRLDGRLRLRDLPFNTLVDRFDQRFSQFHFVERPLPLTFQEYE